MLGKVLHSHRCPHLQIKDLRAVGGRISTSCNVLVVSTAIICSYEAVRLPGIQSLVVGFIAGNWAAMWLIWIGLMASINLQSRKFLQRAQQYVARMSGRRQRILLEKELKSCRELRVFMNSAFYYDKQHVLTTIGFIMNYMATMTLTFKTPNAEYSVLYFKQ